jgi:hypothetical protein
MAARKNPREIVASSLAPNSSEFIVQGELYTAMVNYMNRISPSVTADLTAGPFPATAAPPSRRPKNTSRAVGSEMAGAPENFIITKDKMEQLKKQLQKAIRELPEFDKLKNHIDMTVTNEGLRIALTESEAGTFFDSGSAKISTDGGDLLKILAGGLGKLPINWHLRPYGFETICRREQL